MAFIASPSLASTAAVVAVASSPYEDLIKRTEEALTMSGVNEM